MKTQKQKGSMTLTAIVTLTLSILIILGMISAGTKLLQKENNVEKLPAIAQLTQRVANYDFTTTTTKTYSQTHQIIQQHNELIMFFSSGNKPIRLEHRTDCNSCDREEDENHVDTNHWLEFSRPEDEACKTGACVCHCAMPRNFWKYSEETETHLLPTTLLLSTPEQTNSFTCAQLTCQEIQGTTNQNIQFGNSRGRDEIYVQELGQLIDTKNEKKTGVESYYPIPLDIVLLIQNRARDDGNLFFGDQGAETKIGWLNPINQWQAWIGDSYNYGAQDDGYIAMLGWEYQWSGGVVIGGSGSPAKKSDRDDHVFRDVITPITITKHETHPGILGVCLQETCLYENALNDYNKNQEEKDRLQEQEDMTLEAFTVLETYMQTEFITELNTITTKDQRLTLEKELQKKILKLFEILPTQEHGIRLKKLPENKIVFTLIFEGQEKRSFRTNLPWILDSTSTYFETEELFIDEAGEKTITLEDGVQRTIKIVELDNTNILLFQKT